MKVFEEWPSLQNNRALNAKNTREAFLKIILN